jgi:hypothetical protein
VEKIKINRWDGTWFARKSDLWDAHIAGLIDVQISPASMYGNYYAFMLKTGETICTLYKDFGYDWGSQLYGIRVPPHIANNTVFEKQY